MNKNLKVFLIAIFVVAFLLFLAYIILKSTFGINKSNLSQAASPTTAISGDTTTVNFPSFDFNSPENLALRRYKAATGQNAI